MNHDDDIEFLQSKIKENDNADTHSYLKEASEDEKQESNHINIQIQNDEIHPDILEDENHGRDSSTNKTVSTTNQMKRYKTYPLEFKKRVIADVIYNLFHIIN